MTMLGEGVRSKGTLPYNDGVVSIVYQVGLGRRVLR